VLWGIINVNGEKKECSHSESAFRRFLLVSQSCEIIRLFNRRISLSV
jgi:hypothetical protein